MTIDELYAINPIHPYMIWIDDGGKVHGLSVKRSWTVKPDDSVPNADKWHIKDATIDYKGIHILELTKECTKQLVIDRQKQERICNNQEFVEGFSGKRIHYSVMGTKIVSPQESYNKTLKGAMAMTPEQRKAMAEALLRG